MRVTFRSDVRIAAIGDLHFPFHSARALERAYQIVGEFAPDVVVQIGDIYDMISQTRFARSFNIMTPNEEATEGRLCAINFWKTMRKLSSPKAAHFQLRGNHDERPEKRLLEKCPELESIVTIKPHWEFKDVYTIHDPREELYINDMIFMHGYRTRLGAHMAYNHMSTICGHTHRGGVVFEPIRDKLLFEANCGYLGDPEAAALCYSKQKLSKWTWGLVLIDKNGPRFVPIY